MPAPGVKLSVKVDGAEDVGRALQRLQMRAEDLRPVLREIGAALVTSTRHRFETQRAPDGDTWPPSAAALAEGRATLRRTARLFKSITFAVHPAAVEVGTNVIYAAPHQFGGDVGRGHAVELVPRPFLGFDRDDRIETLEIINDYLRGGL